MSARAGEAPLLLAGRPPLLFGMLEVANDGEKRLALGRRSVSLRNAQGGPAVAARVHFLGGVRPHESARLPVHVVVDSGTPPGTYTTDVEVGGVSRLVELRVLERAGVTVTPGLVQFTAAAGEEIATELLISNHGNVRHALGRRAVVFFEESHWVGRALVFALREADADEGAQRYLDRVVHELVTTMAPTTTLHLEPGADHVEPGEQTLVRLSATLPAELIKGRTYLASFTYAGTDVCIEIVVNGAANSHKRRPA